jgi:hypothetical protein
MSKTTSFCVMQIDLKMAAAPFSKMDQKSFIFPKKPILK